MSSKYTKDELKKAKRFSGKEDAIEALLEEDCLYTISEAEEILVNFMEGCV